LLKNKAKRVRVVRERKSFALLPTEKRASAYPGIGVARTHSERPDAEMTADKPSQRKNIKPIVLQKYEEKK